MKAIVTKDSYTGRWSFEFMTGNNKGIADSTGTYARASSAVDAVRLIAGKKIRIEIREEAA